jgi:hypothetical protein
MLLAHRTPVQEPAQTAPAASSPIDRIPTAVLAFAVLCSLLLSGLTADRIARVERQYQPALEETRQLAAALEATRAPLNDRRLGALDTRITRADSQAQRFHRIAATARRGAEPRARTLDYDAAFGDYYVAGRRAAAGLSLSPDADGSSAEDASLGYGLLREDLALGLETQTKAIDAARPATAPVELAAWLTLGLLAGAVLLRRSSMGRGDWPVAARAAVRDDRRVPVADDRGPVVPLNVAVERLARQRLAASVAAARVAKRNNERQIELARTWIASAPTLSIVRDETPRGEMGVFEDDETADEPRLGGLALVTA